MVYRSGLVWTRSLAVVGDLTCRSPVQALYRRSLLVSGRFPDLPSSHPCPCTLRRTMFATAARTYPNAEWFIKMGRWQC